MRLTLRNAILRSGHTQRDIARATNIREPRFSEIVRGWAAPTPEERAAIAGALGRQERGLFRDTPMATLEVATVGDEGPDDAAA